MFQLHGVIIVFFFFERVNNGIIALFIHNTAIRFSWEYIIMHLLYFGCSNLYEGHKLCCLMLVGIHKIYLVCC